MKRSLSNVLFLILSLSFLISPCSYADDITDYSVLASNSIHMKKEVKILSGDVGVNDRAVSDALKGDVELFLDKKILGEEGVLFKAPSILIKKETLIKEEIRRMKGESDD